MHPGSHSPRISVRLWKAAAAAFAVTLLGTAAPAIARDLDNNPPGHVGGAGTNWENRPGPAGGPGTSPDRHRFHRRDRDNNPPGHVGGPGTNWENRPGPAGGPGTSPNIRPHRPHRPHQPQG